MRRLVPAFSTLPPTLNAPYTFNAVPKVSDEPVPLRVKFAILPEVFSVPKAPFPLRISLEEEVPTKVPVPAKGPATVNVNVLKPIVAPVFMVRFLVNEAEFNTGWKGVPEGIVTSIVDVGTNPVHQLAPLSHRLETVPFHWLSVEENSSAPISGAVPLVAPSISVV